MRDRSDIQRHLPRREFLCRLLLAVPAALLPSAWNRVLAGPEQRALSFRHTHTNETLSIVYWSDGAYLSNALRQIDHLLRDFRTAETHPIDPALLDILHRVANEAGSRGVYEVISGYRSAETNAKLARGNGGVAKRSLHMQGRAIDVRLTGVRTAVLRDVALGLKLGGVGYYGRSDFIHLDTGRFRTW
jgi:uncharacterized protein YcbK (DUF882 family)